MSRHKKSALFISSAIVSLLSLAVSTSVLAQRGGNRGAQPEQVATTTEEDNSEDNRPRRRGEQVRTEQEQAAQANRESRAPQKPMLVQENDQRNDRRNNERNNPRIEIVRQQNERDDARQRQQLEQQEQQNRMNRQIAERDAAARRLEDQRESDARSRYSRENQNNRPDDRPDNRGGNRPDRNDNNDRDNNRNRDNLIGNKLPRPEQQREQRQWQEQQQRQANDYRRHLDGQRSNAERFTQRLREQNRNEQYRSQQRYFDRLNSQRRHFDNNRHDYYRGSHIYSPIIYRYNRGGRYYYANRYQADLMRQAINYGYEEGYYAGRADRMDRWGYNFRDAYAYQDANYGYGGYYVDRGTYNYYFREGFRRGYDDGYYSRYRYGRSYNNGYSLNDSVFRLILNFSDWRH